MKLPKLYRVVTIRFWSIRMAVGCNLGVTEVDVQVERKARRVLCDDGWKWQLLHNKGLWAYSLESDKVCVDDSINEVEIINRAIK